MSRQQAFDGIDQLGAPALTDVLNAVRSHRYHCTNEDELQQGLHVALLAAGLPSRREVRLHDSCGAALGRVDILVGDVAVEVKVKGQPDAVARQLARYGRSPWVHHLVLVTTSARHSAITLPGMVVHVVVVGAL